MEQAKERLPREIDTHIRKSSIELVKDLTDKDAVDTIRATSEDVFREMNTVQSQSNMGYFHFCCLSVSKRKFMLTANHVNNELWSSFKSQNNIKTSTDLFEYFMRELESRSEHTRYFPSIKKEHDPRGWFLAMISKQEEEIRLLKDDLKEKNREIEELKLGKRHSPLKTELELVKKELDNQKQENSKQSYQFEQLKKEAMEHKMSSRHLKEIIKHCNRSYRQSFFKTRRAPAQETE